MKWIGTDGRAVGTSAFYDDEKVAFLESLGVSGRLVCGHCAAPLTTATVKAVARIDRRLRFACGRDLCLRALAAAARRGRLARPGPDRQWLDRVSGVPVAYAATWPGLQDLQLGAELAGAILVAYLLLRPVGDTLVERLAQGAGRALGVAARRHEAHAVEVEINGAVDALLGHAPRDLLEGPMSLRFKRAGPDAWMDDDEVVVEIHRSGNHGVNVVAALTTYLQAALIPAARAYVADRIMLAVDYTFGTMLLATAPGSHNAARVFETQKRAATAGDPELERRIGHLDSIDLHGWLLRILLPELKRVGDALSPGVPTPAGLRETERFADWLHELAVRSHGDRSTPLRYPGRDFRTGIVMIGDRGLMSRHGTEPHRKRAKRNMYDERLDAIYFTARGRRTVARARDEVFASLRHRPGVYLSRVYVYRLRADFFKRIGIRRSRALVAYLWMRPQAREFSRLHLPIRQHRHAFSLRRRRREHGPAT